MHDVDSAGLHCLLVDPTDWVFWCAAAACARWGRASYFRTASRCYAVHASGKDGTCSADACRAAGASFALTVLRHDGGSPSAGSQVSRRRAPPCSGSSSCAKPRAARVDSTRTQYCPLDWM
jgi:hypothetical protein